MDPSFLIVRCSLAHFFHTICHQAFGNYPVHGPISILFVAMLWKDQRLYSLVRQDPFLEVELRYLRHWIRQSMNKKIMFAIWVESNPQEKVKSDPNDWMISWMDYCWLTAQRLQQVSESTAVSLYHRLMVCMFHWIQCQPLLAKKRIIVSSEAPRYCIDYASLYLGYQMCQFYHALHNYEQGVTRNSLVIKYINASREKYSDPHLHLIKQFGGLLFFPRES